MQYVIGTAALLGGISIPAIADSCRVAKAHTPSDAEDAYLHAKYADAETLYRQALSGNPSDATLTAALVRSLVRQQKVSEAAATAKSALAAAPKSAVLLTALAEVQYRQGEMTESDKTSTAAYNADLCYARVHLVRARLARLNSMYGYENQEIATAHALDPYDPDIRGEWIGTLPLNQRIEEFKNYLNEPTGIDEQERHDAEMYLDEMEKRSTEPQRRCRLVSTTATTKIPFENILADEGRVRSWALMAKFNGKDAKLEVDTGAHGLYISRRIAEKAGLQALVRTESYGFGDRGPDAGFTAYVDSIRVGNLEFRDCLVDVSGRKNLIESDGLIGMDIFSDFLVSLDYPRRQLELSPLPTRGGESAAIATLRTAEYDQDLSSEDHAENSENGKSNSTESKPTDSAKRQAESRPKDRYISPEMKDWFPIFRAGHNLIIPVTINKKIIKLFVIDTGSESTIISKNAAGEIERVFETPERRIFGINGEVKHVYSAGAFTLQFADKLQDTSNAVVLDTSRISNGLGIEISGFIGLPTLKLLTIRVDYRDGLVKFDYDPGLAQRNE